MAEYIEREKAIEHIETHLPYRCSEDFIEGQKDCVEQLKSLPSADVVEVVHGEWLRDTDWKYDYHCSVCNDSAIKDDYGNYDVLTDYCPYCGAKMDAERRSSDG